MKFLPRENISQKTSTISRIVYHSGNHIAVYKLALIKRCSLSNSSNVCNIAKRLIHVYFQTFYVYLCELVFFGECIKCLTRYGFVCIVYAPAFFDGFGGGILLINFMFSRLSRLLFCIHTNIIHIIHFTYVDI